MGYRWMDGWVGGVKLALFGARIAAFEWMGRGGWQVRE